MYMPLRSSEPRARPGGSRSRRSWRAARTYHYLFIITCMIMIMNIITMIIIIMLMIMIITIIISSSSIMCAQTG